MFKFIRLLLLMSCLIIGSSCQSFLGYFQSDKQEIQKIVANYFIVHGMGLGYLNSNVFSMNDFQKIIRLDLLARYYIILALKKPNQKNLYNAKQTIMDLINVISKKSVYFQSV